MVSGRGRLGAALLVVGGVLLAGCDSGDEAGAPPMSTVTPTEAGTATSAPEVTPPQMPEAAREATDEGASAFVRHYFALLDYAYGTGHVAPVRAVSEVSCAACEDAINDIDRAYSTGGSITGGTLEVVDVSTRPGSARAGLDSVVVLRQAQGQVRSADGQIVETIPAVDSLTIRTLVQRLGDEWTMTAWGSNDAPTT